MLSVDLPAYLSILELVRTHQNLNTSSEYLNICFTYLLVICQNYTNGKAKSKKQDDNDIPYSQLRKTIPPFIPPNVAKNSAKFAKTTDAVSHSNLTPGHVTKI